jgi:protein phosphatase
VFLKCKTDRGKISEINEDYVLTFKSNKYCLIIVADGMGGHNAGEVASNIASVTIRNFVFENFSNYVDKEELIRDAIVESNNKVFEKSFSDEKYRGMGTTVTCSLICENYYYIGHVGDSRAYILNNSGITKITQDHSYVQELVDNGIITDSEAENHPNRNLITRSVGIDKYVIVDTRIGNIGNGDMILLCSDGLTTYVNNREIFEIVTLKKEEAVDDLVKLAIERGGRDNISVVIARKEGEND